MIRIAICDDEANIRAYLSSLIRAQSCPCEIVEYASAGDCLADHREFDLLFLDIELAPSGPDGMELAGQIRARTTGTQPVIIFVTGYERYVFDAFDVARNEAVMPGSTWDMSQAVSIGEDGNICNVCSSSPGRITYSKSGSDDEESWWDLRMARHAGFMRLAVEKQIDRHIQASQLAASAAAKSQLAAMLNGGNLLNIFGSEIAGIPTETVLAITQAQVRGGGSIF